jgi:hypothetical protein
MSLISERRLRTSINGVSQQPNALRLASSVSLQENCSSSVVDGLCPRNGTRSLGQDLQHAVTNAFTHLINRDADRALPRRHHGR